MSPRASASDRSIGLRGVRGAPRPTGLRPDLALWRRPKSCLRNRTDPFAVYGSVRSGMASVAGRADALTLANLAAVPSDRGACGPRHRVRSHHERLVCPRRRQRSAPQPDHRRGAPPHGRAVPERRALVVRSPGYCTLWDAVTEVARSLVAMAMLPTALTPLVVASGAP